MLARLDPPRYSIIKDLARDLITQYPLINAVVNGIQNGYVYVSPSGDSFFVATKSGFSLFHLEDHSPRSDAALFDFLRHNHDIPNYIHIYSPSRSFSGYLATNWDKYKIRKRTQFRYYQRDIPNDYKRLLPAGYYVAAVQQIDFHRLEEAFKLDFGGRYWNSKEDFLASAVGACILTENDEPAAVCYSACVVDGIAEMDTLVLADHRGKRFMRFVSEPFFEMTASKALIPHWDTFVENTASYALARKFGLELVREYDLLSLLLR